MEFVYDMVMAAIMSLGFIVAGFIILSFVVACCASCVWIYWFFHGFNLARKQAKEARKVKLCSEADIEFKTFLRAVARECGARGVQFTSVQFARCRYREGLSAKRAADEWIKYVEAQ